MFFDKVEFYKADDGRNYTYGTSAEATEGAYAEVINSPKSVAGDVEKTRGGGIRGAEADDGIIPFVLRVERLAAMLFAFNTCGS